MPINVSNPDADALKREFAQTEGVSITNAIVIAMKEATSATAAAIQRSLWWPIPLV